jgi:membrane protease YdiL (CAAX protease family)
MTRPSSHPPKFWNTVRLLLASARKRAAGRKTRQRELFQHKRATSGWSGVLGVFAALFMMLLNAGAAWVVVSAVVAGERLHAERRGKVVVSRRFLQKVASETEANRQIGWPVYYSEANQIVEKYGGTRREVAEKLRAAVRRNGAEDLISSDEAAPGLSALPRSGRLAGLLGSIALFFWATMLIFQGEGLDLDVQRRRHPMWEWLFSHPVPAGAIFFAEMLSPLAANPIYWGAPLFAGILYGLTYGFGPGVLAAVAIGIPASVALACLGKALEIAVILRFSPRSRGAMVGLMGWLGYASMMLFLLATFVMGKIATIAGKVLEPLTLVPWPWLEWFLGGRGDGSFSLAQGLAFCAMVSGTTTAAAVWFGVWGAKQGLGGKTATDLRPARARDGEATFGKRPLYRKEFLWFVRDRSAIVQVILIPITVAGVQAFNMRGILSHAQGAWNYLCGVAIVFGTYFLWILGPKSLSSEGPALWIALTWPQGLESLLKAKAWLWSLISTGIVALVLSYAAFLYPGEIWKIALVGVGWFFFAQSMAQKSVTLVSVTSTSGEQEKVPRGRRWAAALGMLTFAIGVLSQQWHVAVMGIVYSYMTAAAMWQNFRARLPYLYDPWSEKIPPPPTLMHAMIAISILVEGGAVVSGLIAAFAGPQSIAMAVTISYGTCAVLVSVGVSNFLSKRGVMLQEVWFWETGAAEGSAPWWRGGEVGSGKSFLQLLLGVAGGVSLGVLAHGYRLGLEHIPATAQMLRKSQEEMARIPNLRISFAIMAVLFAPFAEEYLFRGLLYRALDREWGGWRAMVGAAAFFAIYHPALSWMPVGLLGAANCWLFKKTGRLAPAVVMHMVYNAVVVGWG